MPLVSAIIPAFNCEPYVAAAVDSVLDQQHRDLELIVIDDGSTDGTVEALSRYRDRIRIVRQPNGGVASARNAGLGAARGELIAFLDADDWWKPERLSAQVAALERYPDAGLVFSDFSVVDFSGDVRTERGGIRWKYGVVRHAAATPWDSVFGESDVVRWAGGEATAHFSHLAHWLFMGNLINTCSVLLRREVVERIGLFDVSLSTEEDYDYWLRVAEDWPMVYVDAPLVAFRRRRGQLTSADQIERIIRNVEGVVSRASARMQGRLHGADVAQRLAGIDRELGVICLRTGQTAEARRRLWGSIRRAPLRASTFGLMALALLPRGVYPRVERAWKRRPLRTQAAKP